MEEEVQIISDAKFEAMLDGLRVTHPELKCRQGNPIQRLCLNPSCQTSLICKETSCPFCGEKAHFTCSTAPFKGLTQLLNERAGSYKSLMNQSIEVDNQLINGINESKRQFSKRFYSTTLEPKHQAIVDQLYNKNDCLSLSGRQAKQFVEVIQRQSRGSKKHLDELVSEYREWTIKLIDAIVSKKRNICLEFSKYQEKNLGREYSIDSSILGGNDESTELKFQYLVQQLNKPNGFKLLYRGSEQGFSSAKFRIKCQGAEDTVALVRNEFGRTFAGYSHVPFDFTKSVTHFETDPQRRAFILALDARLKLIPMNDNVIFSGNKGPCYGQDLCISDQCDRNRQSYFRPSVSYRLSNESQGQGVEVVLAGSKDGRFKVEEYQVFSVLYGNQKYDRINIIRQPGAQACCQIQ